MQPLRGISLKLISVAFFSVMGVLVKAGSVEVPPGEAVFFRSFFAIPVIFVWLAMRHDLREGLKMQYPMKHVGRGLLGTLTMSLGFSGLALLPLPEVTAIGFAAPIIVVVLAAIFLGEHIRLFRISAVILGLAGVLIVLAPAFGASAGDRQTIGAIVVLASAVSGAAAQVYMRGMVKTEHTAAIVFYFSVTASLISLLTIPFGWVVPSPKVALMLIGAGLFGGVGQLLLTSAYRHADVSVIAPFQYAAMLFALIFGYFLFDEVPTATMLAGAVLIMLAGGLIIWRENKLGLERGKARSKMSSGA